MKLHYGLEEAGWATVTVECGTERVEMAASYLHDSLRNLASAVKDLSTTESQAVVFMDEPGEHQLLLRRAEDSIVELEVLWFEDWKSWNLSVGPPTRKLAGSAPLLEVRNQVISELCRLLKENGEEGYRKKWIEHDFPIEELRALEAAG